MPARGRQGLTLPDCCHAGPNSRGHGNLNESASAFVPACASEKRSGYMSRLSDPGVTYHSQLTGSPRHIGAPRTHGRHDCNPRIAQTTPPPNAPANCSQLTAGRHPSRKAGSAVFTPVPNQLARVLRVIAAAIESTPEQLRRLAKADEMIQQSCQP